MNENLDKMEDELQVLIEKVRLSKNKAGVANDELRVLKEDLRVFMIDSGIKEYNGVVIRRTFSWDLGMFKMEFPELYKVYVVEETLTTTATSVKLSKKNKNEIIEKHPDVYRTIIVENTPQVRGL